MDGLGPARYDVCISCFGVMFFADPVAAFTNIGRALSGRAPDIEDLGRIGQERGNLGPPPDAE